MDKAAAAYRARDGWPALPESHAAQEERVEVLRVLRRVRL